MTGRAGSTQAQERSFGARLRRFREAAGLSQVALAGDRLHPSYVSLLEAGRRTPTPDAVATLAARLGISPDELTGESDSELEAPLVLDEAVAVLELLRTAADSAPARASWLPVTVALIRCYREAGDVARAVDVGESAIARFPDGPSRRVDGHAALVSTVAGAYAERGDLLRAQLLLDQLLEEALSSGSLEDQAFAYWNAAINAVERGDAARGLQLSDEATALLSVGSDLRAQARLQASRAWVHLAQDPPEPQAARALLREALPRLRQYAGALSVASAETELARCELLLGRPEVARRSARSALARLGDEHRIERARALAALGASFVALGETAAGVTSLEDAAAALDGAQAPRQAAAVWRQLSSVYRALGDADRALASAERALDGAGLAAEPLVVAGGPVAGRPRRRTPSPS